MRSRRWALALAAAGACVTMATSTATAAPDASAADHVRLHSANWGLMMDVRNAGGAGSPVQLYAENFTAAQRWIPEDAMEGGQYLHPDHNWSLCLDFPGERRHGAPIVVNGCNGSASQRWHYGDQGGGWRRVATHSDFAFCIDVPNANFAQEQTLQLWDCNGTNAQMWWF